MGRAMPLGVATPMPPGRWQRVCAPAGGGGTGMDWQELGLTALRATLIYVFLLVVIRLLGKRTIGNTTAFDFMVALILGEVVDEPIYGDVPVVQALVVIAVIAGWHWVNSYLSYRHLWIDRFTAGSARVLVRNGEIDRGAMATELVNEDELWSMLRENGIERLED